MYNHYIPDQAEHIPVDHRSGPAPNPSPRHHQSGRAQGRIGGLLKGLLGQEGDGKISQTLDRLLKNLHLEHLDTGDILLGLIVLFLVLEDGDDLDLIITLGLTILLNLGES